MRVLRRGFGAAIENRGRVRVFPTQEPFWGSLSEILNPAAHVFEEAGRKWGSTAAAAIASRSFREMLEEADAEPRVQAQATALRGLYLADPEDLSALVVVEQVADGNPGREPIYRVEGGADRLVYALQEDSGCRVDLRHVVRSVEQDDAAVAVSIEGPGGRRATAKAEYLISTVPAPIVLDWSFSPGLSDVQRLAFESLSYGPATKVVMRFSKRWWRRPGRPRAFGTNLPIGAVWESGEEQSKAALMTLLAGGTASASLKAILSKDGVSGVTTRLRWLGGSVREKPEFVTVSWEDDPWSRGGYAVFGPAFDPGLRDALARGAGRVLFAGSHTSRDFQGYMNGAVESGLRAADEVASLERLHAPRR